MKISNTKILRTKLMRIMVHYIIFVIHKMMLLHFLWLQEFEIERALRISRLPEEPDSSSPTAVQVLLRLPSGQRLERRFTETDKLEVWNSTTYIKMLLSFFSLLLPPLYSLCMTLPTLLRGTSCLISLFSLPTFLARNCIPPLTGGQPWES